MIHQDQTGFIPKRSIHNNIRLASTIINYTKLTGSDRAIITLDQKKAYNRIRHNYLWKTLKSFNIPNTFIRTRQELYKNTYTTVAINKVHSKPFKVTREVRQGGPLSPNLSPSCPTWAKITDIIIDATAP
jgi:reverse transcriptase-like protein